VISRSNPLWAIVLIAAGKAEKKKETKLGLNTRKAEDFGAWYSEVVVESEMISYYDVSGNHLPA
jgi:prolyl-tRNA synthetase